MFYGYLFATVVGGLLLLVSLLGGGEDHQGDAGHDTDHAHEHGESSALGFFLSIRLWTYALTFGGATGLLLRWAGQRGEPVTALLAAGVGITAGLLARTIIGRAGRGSPSATPVSHEALAGRSGHVMVPFARGATGRIRVHVQGADIDLLATTDDDGDLAVNQSVLIIQIHDGTASVTRSPADDDEGGKA